MADKGGAYGTKAGDTDFRKKWDKEEYAERARKKDEEEKDRMKENEERMKQGVHGYGQVNPRYSQVLIQGRNLSKLEKRMMYPNLRSS